MAKVQRRVGGPAWVEGDPTLTVGEIAERLSPIAPNVAGTVQRIRHWTREQMLLPVDQLHAGTGKHRRYAADAVYDAAILHVATTAGLNVSSQRYLIDALTQARFALPKWKRARSQGEAPPLYLCLERRADGTERTVTRVSDDPGEPSEDFTMIIDLARLFARVGG
jgi:DNA-binding transcriptional MerR regulator